MKDRRSGIKLLLLLLVCVFHLSLSEGYGPGYDATQTAPMVITNSGCARGKLLEMPNSNHVSAFLGIPYAEPPTGNNRYKKPIPAKSWNGIYDATTKPPPCMQHSDRQFPWIPVSQPSEDCLYLNVWVPGLCQYNNGKTTRKLPVLVWIYGGGFSFGSTDMPLYDGATIAATGNVIVASMNYRLGAFGFLQGDAEEAPGNMGLYDQNLALKWIKDNIARFGGDPDSITLFGESAGAISVGLHLISPLSRNLFDRAILQSGSPYHPSAAFPPQFTKLKASEFAAAAGCANDTTNFFTDPKSVLACLRTIEPAVLSRIEGELTKNAAFSFVPGYGNDFMPQPPIAAVEAGDFKKADVLIGGVPAEGAVLVYYLMPNLFPKEAAPRLDITTGRMLAAGLFQNSTRPTPDAVADFYLRDVDPNDSVAIARAVCDSFGDFLLFCPMQFLAEKMKSDVFFYLYTHRPSNTPWGEWMGTTHFDDVPFVFGDPLRNSSSYTEEEWRFSKSLIDRWTNFARYGKPTSEGSQEQWPKFNASNLQYLELNPKNANIGSGFHKEACEFWRTFFTPAF